MIHCPQYQGHHNIAVLQYTAGQLSKIHPNICATEEEKIPLKMAKSRKCGFIHFTVRVCVGVSIIIITQMSAQSISLTDLL